MKPSLLEAHGPTSSPAPSVTPAPLGDSADSLGSEGRDSTAIQAQNSPHVTFKLPPRIERAPSGRMPLRGNALKARCMVPPAQLAGIPDLPRPNREMSSPVTPRHLAQPSPASSRRTSPTIAKVPAPFFAAAASDATPPPLPAASPPSPPSPPPPPPPPSPAPRSPSPNDPGPPNLAPGEGTVVRTKATARAAADMAAEAASKAALAAPAAPTPTLHAHEADWVPLTGAARVVYLAQRFACGVVVLSWAGLRFAWGLAVALVGRYGAVAREIRPGVSGEALNQRLAPESMPQPPATRAAANAVNAAELARAAFRDGRAHYLAAMATPRVWGDADVEGVALAQVYGVRLRVWRLASGPEDDHYEHVATVGEAGPFVHLLRDGHHFQALLPRAHGIALGTGVDALASGRVVVAAAHFEAPVDVSPEGDCLFLAFACASDAPSGSRHFLRRMARWRARVSEANAAPASAAASIAGLRREAAPIAMPGPSAAVSTSDENYAVMWELALAMHLRQRVVAALQSPANETLLRNAIADRLRQSEDADSRARAALLQRELYPEAGSDAAAPSAP